MKFLPIVLVAIASLIAEAARTINIKITRATGTNTITFLSDIISNFLSGFEIALAEKVRGLYVRNMHPGTPTVERGSVSSFHWFGAAFRCLREGVETRILFQLILLSVGLVLVQPCGASGGFENTGSLASARYLHTATLLPNGKVLVAGGSGGTEELFDPVSGTWTGTGSLARGRSGHTATLLPDGKVLVAAGGPLLTIRSAELYDPASGTWAATSSLTGARENHTATLLPTGKVLVAGGFFSDGKVFGSIYGVEVYDPTSGTWTSTGSLADPRYDPQHCCLTVRFSWREV